MAIDDRAAATVALHLAQAGLRLAKLEAEEKEVPAMSGTSNRRLTLARKLTSARRLVDGWTTVQALVESERQAAADTTDRDHAPVVPERTVAWVMRPDSSGRTVKVCNNSGGLCKSGYSVAAEWAPLRSDDLPAGLVCAQCGTDVLA